MQRNPLSALGSSGHHGGHFYSASEDQQHFFDSQDTLNEYISIQEQEHSAGGVGGELLGAIVPENLSSSSSSYNHLPIIDPALELNSAAVDLIGGVGVGGVGAAYNGVGGGGGAVVDEMAVLSEMASLEEHEQKIVAEFVHLLDKSKNMFNGLRFDFKIDTFFKHFLIFLFAFLSRDLPQYGKSHWQPYFGRTFDVFTKLWKFQSQHRQVLDTKYGLKRWQIGEIASKIGQLYYHY